MQTSWVAKIFIFRVMPSLFLVCCGPQFVPDEASPSRSDESETIDPATQPTSPPWLNVWTEDPWLNTVGGSLVPTQSEVDASTWGMTLLANDTEQMLIGIMSTASAPQKVSISITKPWWFRGGKVDLYVAGAIENRQGAVALVNLFTAEQVNSFNGAFPPRFVGEEAWREFPTLHLSPNTPVRVWLRVRSYGGEAPGSEVASAGQYPLNLVIRRLNGQELLTKRIVARVLPLAMPTKMPVEVLAYGGIDESLDRNYHTTVRGNGTNFLGHKNAHYMNLLSHSRSGLFNQHLEKAAELYRSDPAEFRRAIRAAVDAYYVRMEQEDGWRQEQILMTLHDEPNVEMLDNYILVAREVKAYRPNAKLVANPGQKDQEIFERLDPYIDIWIPHETAYRIPRIKSFLKNTNKPLWFYSNFYGEASRKEPRLLSLFRRGGWAAIQHDLAGMGFWSATTYFGDKWDDFDGDSPSEPGAIRNDAALVFDSDAGPIITRGYEAWRESVEDVALFRMIEDAYRQGRFGGSWVERANTWITNTPAEMGRTRDADPAAVIAARAEAWNLLKYLSN